MGRKEMTLGKLMGRKHSGGVVGGMLAGVLLAGLVSAAPALALSPVWTITSIAAPTHLAPGSTSSANHDQIILRAENVSGAPAEGGVSPVVVSDMLPAGLTATNITGSTEGQAFLIPGSFRHEMSCTPSPLRCTSVGTVAPYEVVQIVIGVDVKGDAVSGVNRGSISGGGATSVSVAEPVTVSAVPAGFGVEHYDLTASNEDGSADTQAGSHPYQVTATLDLNQKIGPSLHPGSGGRSEEATVPSPVRTTKDLQFRLPAGLVGNPTVIPQCTEQAFASNQLDFATLCPDDTAIGVAAVSVTFGNEFTVVVPLFNLVPSVGEPARFGFLADGVRVYLDTSVRAGSDYGVTVSVNNITQLVGFDASEITFWGVPNDPSHDAARGWACLNTALARNDGLQCPAPKLTQLRPFLLLPTSCAGAWSSTVLADSWEEPGVFTSGESTEHDTSGRPVGLDGCNRLDFSPSIKAAPNSTEGSTPTGLTVNVHVPQEVTLTPSGLGESDVKSTTVALPAGVQLSPSAADGLQVCSDAQIGFTGVNPQTGTDEFTSSAPACPEASKVATVRINTPLLPNALEGAVYLAAPQNFLGGPLENPFGSLVAMYIVAEDPVSGILVKLPGKVSPDPVSGQLTATFPVPQLPFEDAKLEFFGSARAPLSTPPLCGIYTTQTSIEPWSGNPPSTPSSSFQIASGPNGAPCSDPQPFNPGFQSGSTNLQASAFTPFTLTMSRPDADQTLSRVELQMPPGLLGSLASVKLCPEPQAAQGTCGEDSLIGHTIVSAGLGNDPYTVTGGKVFITGSYKGAPYGLSIVNPAVAGPFNLGTVVVRASISIDPHTAALSIKSDPLPTILDGIPLQIQHVNVTIDRDRFTFNPSNCTKTAINGMLSSTEGASAAVSTSFQVTNCATLAFKPKFTVSTSGKTSRAGGASLHVKLTYPTGPFDANIAKVKVDLPKQLPSRLTTLQKACTARVFEANPASCPAASLIGSARAVTPVLPVPLSGPVYFVSHGGEAFPTLIVVLQGYGTTVDLEGATFISKAGITSSTFKTVPDVPVGTFELTLPEGKYSALAANGNLCKSKLVMPTAFLAQNGIVIHESTKITTTGCPKAKKARKAKKHKKGTKVKGKKGSRKAAVGRGSASRG
jgi:hypothetical protein